MKCPYFKDCILSSSDSSTCISTGGIYCGKPAGCVIAFELGKYRKAKASRHKFKRSRLEVLI